MAVDPQPSAPLLEDMLCLALHSASRAMTGRYRALLSPFGVTYPQYLVLLVLDELGPSSLVSIGAELRLESSTLSPLVKRLEAQGLIFRARSTTDERAVTVRLTAQGSALCERLGVVPGQITAATGLDPVEKDRLVGQLHQLEGFLRS